ncbi:hypothetical protein MP638_003781 [Amoeboaphelidium occidentale]|nr:hypothetical protein MP638_003781 [Amoeboaphelidium occidentale]
MKIEHQAILLAFILTLLGFAAICLFAIISILYVFSFSFMKGLMLLCGYSVALLVGLVVLNRRFDNDISALDYRPKGFDPKDLQQRKDALVESVERRNLISLSEFHSSSAVQAELSVLLDVVIQQFIMSWYLPLIAIPPTNPYQPKKPNNDAKSKMLSKYHKIVVEYLGDIERPLTQPPSKFVDVVDYSIRYAFLQLKNRVSAIQDWVPLISSKVLPLLTKHLHEFKKASLKISQKGRKTLTQSEELNLMVAGMFKQGKLHPALLGAAASGNTKSSELVYLRQFVDKCLPWLMAEKEYNSRLAKPLVREIVAGLLLYPLIEMLSDPDYWNQWIDESATEAIQEQRMVHKMREALEKPFQDDSNEKNKPPSFDEYLKGISTCDNLFEARRIRHALLIEISRRKAHVNAKNGSMIRYVNRLNVALKQVDKKIQQLGGAEASTDALKRTELDFDTLLEEPGLSYFREFMDRENKLDILQFFLSAEAILGNYRGITGESSISLPSLKNYSSFLSEEKLLNFQAQLKDDLLVMKSLCINSPNLFHNELLIMSRNFVRSVDNAKNLDDSLGCLVMLFNVKNIAHESMKERYFEGFCNSDSYFKYVASLNSRQISVTSVGSDSLQTKRTFMESMAPVRKAVMNPLKGLATITANAVKAPINAGKDLLAGKSLSARPPVIVTVTPSTGDNVNSNVAEQESINSHMVGTSSETGSFISILPNDEQDGILDDSRVYQVEKAFQSILLEKNANEPVSAAPADSDLSEDESENEYVSSREGINEEELSDTKSEESQNIHLNNSTKAEYDDVLKQIERNEQHQLILEIMQSKFDSVPKSKNQQKEVKLLNKMKWQYEQERLALLSQKKQLELQLSDNFIVQGKTLLSIPSWAVSEDAENQKPFVVYIIQVEQQASGHNWIVARRYNEFFNLNRALRTHFGNKLNSVEFPGKRLLHGLPTNKPGSSIQAQTKELEFREERRKALEKYMNGLLKIDAICKSDEFRNFLCTDQNFDSKGNILVNSLLSLKDLPRDLMKSLKNGLFRFGSGLNIVGPFGEPVSYGVEDPEESIKFDNQNQDLNELEFSAETFSNLIVEIFDLQEKNNWWRKQATTWIIQQVLGGQLERKIYDSVKSMFSEENLVNVLARWRELLSSMNSGNTVLRSSEEKNKTRFHVYRKLHILVPDLIGPVVGRSNAKRGSTRIFEALQNKHLNAELLYQILDLLGEVLQQ